MFKLAHISDVHLGPLPNVRMRDLMGKRVTGYANWRMNRRKSHGGNSVDLIVDDIHASGVDHIAVTGDLVNLALDAEIGTARQWLETLGSAEVVSVVPGNHDAYVRGALAKACHAWSGYIPKSDQSAKKRSVSNWFPFVRRFDNVALIGCSSAIASAPFMAIGRFGRKQGERLKAALEEAGREGLFRVVMIHHPPFRYKDDFQRRLYGIRLFQKIVATCGAELVLHGHTHIDSFTTISGRDNLLPVIGVPSAAQNIGGVKPPAGWNEFTITGEAGAWTCHWRERALQPDRSIGLVRERLLWNNGKLQVGDQTIS